MVEIRAGRNTKDFGTGFYCTVIKEQAQRWAKRYDDKIVSALTGAPPSLSVSGSWRRDACQRGTENDGIFRAKRRRAKPPDLLTDRTIM